MKKRHKLLSLILCICLILPGFTYFVSAADTGVVVESDNQRALPTDMGENLVANQLPLYADFYEHNNATAERTVNLDNFNITNGVLGDSWHHSQANFADFIDGNPVIYNDGSAYFNITFRLKKTTKLSGICVLHHPTRDMVTGIYELYASTDYRKLYWEENMIAHIDNDTADCRQIVTCNISEVNYVGMKFIYPAQLDANSEAMQVTASKNNHYPRLSEFSVYGKEQETRAEYPEVTNLSSKTVVSEEPKNADILDMKDSFLYGVKETVTYRDGGTTDKTGTTNSDRLTDGDITNGDWYTSNLRFFQKSSTGVVTNNTEKSNYYVDINFDAGAEKSLGLFHISNHKNTALRLMHYKIYASNNSESIVSDANLIADCYNYNGARDHYFTVPEGKEIKARYYTVRVFDPCFDYSSRQFWGDYIAVNPYIRINEISAYSTDYLEAKLELSGFQKRGDDYGYIRAGTEVKSVVNAYTGKGNVQVLDKNGNVKALSNMLTFGDKVVADTGYGEPQTADFKFCGDINASGTYTVSDVVAMRNAALRGSASFVTELGDTDSDGSITVTDVSALLQTMLGTGKMVEDTSAAPTTGQKAGVKTADIREISVDPDTVINEDFRGFGSNCFPAILSPEGMEKTGYNKVYNELNRKRLATIKPAVTRMWFQVDWMVTDTEPNPEREDIENNLDYAKYKFGIYDFDSEMMQAVYEYIDMLNEAGGEVEINFGWKTATRIKEWFNAPCDDFMVGAPRELNYFGNAAAALVKELNKRGYDNVTAIAFYNEPNLTGDFEISTVDDRIYWSQLLYEVDKAMKAKGVRDLIEIWGPEVSSVDNSINREWFCYQLENTAPCIDQWTGHHYYRVDTSRYSEKNGFNNYFNAFNTFKDYVELTDGNFMVTEMYGRVTNEIYSNWFDWNDSTTSYLIAASNTGVDGVLSWSFVGGYLPDPLGWVLSCSQHSPWEMPCSEEAALTVNRVFYEQSLFTNYVPDGAKVLYTGWTGDDIRASSYLLPDGNITVLVENNGTFSKAVLDEGEGEEKQIRISIGDGKTRTFRRISYIAETQVLESNATVNSPDKEILAEGGVFTDTLGEQYSVHIYTTAPIIKQVKIQDVAHHTKASGAVYVSAELVDCDESDTIVYSISEYTGAEAGKIQKNGIYIAPESAKSGDMVAVRASLKSDPSIYAVAIIYID